MKDTDPFTMRREYKADELLPLSGIQHFLFCRRQWALIHIETEWHDNVFTAEGAILHERVNDPFFTETRNDVVTSRSVPVASYVLGISGICDVVEFQISEGGVHLPGRDGQYQPIPVEYKRGNPKKDPVDEAQLCAQAMCLEEMLSTEIPKGFIFYGKTRHREEVVFTQALRQLVQDIAGEMHSYFKRGHTPRVRITKSCRACSLVNACLPVLQGNIVAPSIYIQKHLSDIEKGPLIK